MATNTPEATALESLPVAELRKLAEKHGIDLAGAKKKADIIATIQASPDVPEISSGLPYQVTAARLNGRDTPSVSGQVIGVVDQGDVVQVVETKTVAGQKWARTEAGVWHLAEHLKEQS